MVDIKKTYTEFCQTKVPYFRQYTHDLPLIMTFETYSKTKELGRILNKAIHHLVENYLRFSGVMQLSDRDLQILEICNKYPFRIGTYRTDFVIDTDNRIKIIEATTRLPLNGYINFVFSSRIGEELTQDLGLNTVKQETDHFLDFLQNDFLQKGKVTVIKGNERMGDFKLYSELFPTAGIDFNVIDISDLKTNDTRLENALVIEELSLGEIRNLPNTLIEELTAAGIFNDFRNLLLVHNKRFFELITDSDFLSQALTKEEQASLSEFTIPTYTLQNHPDKFEVAKLNKEAWILKPCSFGKSEGITAGCVTPAEEWEELLNSENLHDWVLQPMIPQRKFKGTIGDEIRDDYVAGTFLFFDDHYFGPGIYRASSHVVTNVKDDRKLAQVVANGQIPDFLRDNII